MPIFRKLLHWVYVEVATLSWGALGLTLLAHLALSWALLAAAGEAALTRDPVTFFYYYMTTATTVGYGDLSPATDAGRLVGGLAVLPGAIAVFTAVLGKAVSDIGALWRGRLNGMGDFSERTGHTVVVGWQDGQTRRLVEGLLADRARSGRLVLVSRRAESNPMPGEIDFVRTGTLSDVDSLRRAGAAGADAIVVRGADDDETLAAALAVHAVAGTAHIVAHFEDVQAAGLLERQFPRIEVITSIATDLLVRAARDPGASMLAGLMFSSRTADTAWSLRVPESAAPFSYAAALGRLKARHDLTLMGVRAARGTAVDLNCPADQTIGPGDTIFYIADHRADAGSIDWRALAEGAA